ncbi:MAG: DUF2804 domain-containing protein [Lachnospiraceae bacterium]|nr:DUF2804 domain-containing protein [Lachnospiraceae bacterium]
MRNHEVLQEQPLLDEEGHLKEPGWARQQVWQYNRKAVKAPPWKIKEWDYYVVGNDEFAVAFTISDNGYIGLQSMSFLDFTVPMEHTETVLNLLPLGRQKMPSSSREGDCEFKNHKLHIKYTVTPGQRRIQCKCKKFYMGRPFSCDICLEQPPADSIVTAIPWKDSDAFYYNQKINCMPASGVVRFGGRIFYLDPDYDFGSLDWGRGVWTYDNTWYWASGNGLVEDKPFGFNLGYGFGDTSAATENMIFYDGVGHKLDDVVFHIPQDNYLAPWEITSSDGRFEMKFRPVIDRAAKLDARFLESDQHQVFGRISGHAILDDGKVLNIKSLMCFAEKVHNRY